MLAVVRTFMSAEINYLADSCVLGRWRTAYSQPGSRNVAACPVAAIARRTGISTVSKTQCAFCCHGEYTCYVILIRRV